ncbi:hypothetical protein ABGB12_30445 [Actinocorallia sp. B10E7]|uniref:hypothetical protein n=1 Tax=Actinocorallia sp. B10E7 TaxID=3153558 RepID=UPI00325DA517
MSPRIGVEVPPGTPFRRIRMDDEMWNALAAAVAKADPELDRSKVIRQLVRWYIGETDHLPRRPEQKNASGDEEQS